MYDCLHSNQHKCTLNKGLPNKKTLNYLTQKISQTLIHPCRATPEAALAMVNKILKAGWQDNQLLDSGLTRAEMSQIAHIFVQVWQQFHHKRIPYSKS